MNWPNARYLLAVCRRSFIFGLGLQVFACALLLAQDHQSPENEKPPSDQPTQQSAKVLLRWKSADTTQDSLWEMKDPAGWKWAMVKDDIADKEIRVLRQFEKSSAYQPPHRSPLHIALVKDRRFGSFELECEAKSTHPDYGHRDVCLFFNYESPQQFYYLHLAKEADPHANQLFIVNKSDRKKISLTTSSGTPWDDQWHRIKIKRDIDSGLIEVYFDENPQPIITAKDDVFKSGQIGLGSFDDTADFRSLTIKELQAQSKSR